VPTSLPPLPRSPQRLSPGTPLLSRIHAIYPMHLVLSLPSQLYAHVPLTSLSAPLTARLSAAASSSSSSSHGDDADEEEEEDDVPPLDELFAVGDWYPTSVVRLYAAGESAPPALEGWKPRDGAERDCRRVECSLDPRVVNDGLARVDVEAGFVRLCPAPACLHECRLNQLTMSENGAGPDRRSQVDRRPRLRPRPWSRRFRRFP